MLQICWTQIISSQNSRILIIYLLYYLLSSLRILEQILLVVHVSNWRFLELSFFQVIMRWNKVWTRQNNAHIYIIMSEIRTGRRGLLLLGLSCVIFFTMRQCCVSTYLNWSETITTMNYHSTAFPAKSKRWWNDFNIRIRLNTFFVVFFFF